MQVEHLQATGERELICFISIAASSGGCLMSKVSISLHAAIRLRTSHSEREDIAAAGISWPI